jgi:hypothetical protein
LIASRTRRRKVEDDLAVGGPPRYFTTVAHISGYLGMEAFGTQ